MARKLTVYQINRMPYAEGVKFQRRCVEQLRQSDADEGIFILLEHPPVITIGRSGTDQNIIAPSQLLEREGVAVYETSRGGDVTYHGPGQIVGYPILPLKFHGKDIHRYLRTMEKLLMDAMGDYNIACHRREGLTGVWTERGKLVSIGVAVRHWISYHGFALNVAPNMAHFNLINPCGLKDVTMVCMKDFLGDAPPRAEVEEHVLHHFREAFGFDQMTIHDLIPTCEPD